MTIPRVVRHSAIMLVMAAAISGAPLAAQQSAEQVKTPAGQLEKLQERHAELRRQGFAERHPDVIRLEADIAVLERSLVTRPQTAELQQAPKGFVPALTPRRGFNIVLLLGDMQGVDGQDAIPVAARKALADMKDFLPYKAYRLLDTQWIIGSSSGAAAVTRLRGVEEQEYELELRASSVMQPGPNGEPDPQTLSVRFVLRESDPPGKAESPFAQSKDGKSGSEAELMREQEMFKLERERVDLTTQLATLRRNVEVGMASVDDVARMNAQLTMINQRIVQLKNQSSQAASFKTAGRAVIDSSFRMEEGETVVVGSSGVKGGKRALIALLTAASPVRSPNKKTDAK